MVKCCSEPCIGSGRLVPHRNVRRDALIPEPLQQLCRAIGGIACEPLRLEIEAALDTIHHGLGDGHLVAAIGARAISVEDDPELVVYEIVGIIDEERVHALACDPGRLRISQRDLLGRLAAAAIAGAAAIPAITLLIAARGIESRQVLTHRMRRLLGIGQSIG